MLNGSEGNQIRKNDFKDSFIFSKQLLLESTPVHDEHGLINESKLILF